MDEDDERRERFDMDNDFEGGEYIDGEFFYRSKRQRRTQTKDDIIYGVFADDSDDEGDRRGRRREKADYSKPVSFISTGQVVKPGQEPEREDERPSFAAVGSRNQQDAAATSTSMAGLGAAGGLGFRPSGLGGASAADEREDEGVLPTAFGKRVLQAAEERRRAEAQSQQAEARRQANLQELGGGAGGGGGAGAGSESLQKYGIGLKLLQKMGYKAGEGLGANKQGIAKPVEALMRAKGAGLGLGGEQHKRAGPAPAALSSMAAAASDVAAAPAAAAAPQAKLWKRRNAEQRQRREYRSVQQVLSEAAERPLAVQPILDMRGPQARIVTDLAHLNSAEEQAAGAAAVPMPELQHNLQLLVDLTEAEIRKLDSRLQHEQDTAALLAQDQRRLEADAARQAEALQRLHEVQEEVARCQAAGPALQLAELQLVYVGLKQRFPEEYLLYGLASLALAQALPRLQQVMRGWAPLAAPQQGLAEFSAWRELLQSDAARATVLSTAAAESDPFSLLVLEVLLPPLRASVLNQWQPRDPEPLLELVESWAPVLPPAVLSQLLDVCVMPRIRSAVEGWEPRKETVPIHAWLHPWLPYLGPQLEQVYPTIRHRLGAALAAWHPSDGSALVLLAPWRRVFEPADWEALLGRSIVPKLAYALQELVINPAAQALEPFNWVMAWHGALPARQLVALLEAGFFPKWHQVLRHWLAHKPDYDEVTRWYLGWKALFPQDLLDSERLRAQLNHALDLMNSAVDGVPLPPYQQPQQQHQQPGYGTYGATAAAQPAAPASQYGAAAELTLKELVQRFAEEAGVDFLPKGRFVDGQPVFSFGGVSVLVDAVQGTIRAQIRDRWAPVSLERLLQEQQARARGSAAQ